MENADKVQDVSPEKIETPEEVQQEAESSVNESEERPAKEEEIEEGKPESTADSPTVESEDTEISVAEEKSADDVPQETETPQDAVVASEEPEKSLKAEVSTEDTPNPELVQKESQDTGLSAGDEELVDETPKEAEAPEGEVVASEQLQEELEEETSVEDTPNLELGQKDAEEQTPGEESLPEAKESSEKESLEEPKKSKSKSEKAEEESEEQASSSEEEIETDDEPEDLNFSNASKEELLVKIRELGKEERIQRIDRVIKALKPRFDELHQAERLTALNKFDLEGNDPDSFEYHGDDVDKEFNSLYSTLRSKRNKFYKDLESQKDDNLKKKQSLLEQLRELVDGEESNASFNSVKGIQSDWKKVGPVPGAHNKTLWANYNALLDRFYDQRSIYFELKDLDRKKNLKLKEELCQRAEALANQEELKTAIVQLNELHEEYKHAGSVPREQQEALWQRFKTASDAVYSKRKDYFDNLKEEFEKNYGKKVELAKVAETYISFDSDSITEWNSKTKEIQEIQKQWEAIGGLPRDKAKSVNKQFWGSFKKFFNNKNQFFKKLEGARDENLKKKEDLILQAEELKESSDWSGTTQKYKDLQAKWKDVGPVPEKVRNEIYKRFKAACDHFFERRRAQNSEQDKQYEENFKLKLQICDQIEAIADKDEINLDDVYDLIDNHSQVGFVPRNAIKKDRARFEEATEKILTLEELEPGDKSDLKNHIQLRRMKSSPGGDRKVQRKEHSVKRKISELESNINTWNTNMEFFAASATADKLKADLQQRINEARGELESLKSQLSSIN
ncbi:MAG: DUF349 domain-containing protein [Cyclobacteriaceae bacterium]